MSSIRSRESDERGTGSNGGEGVSSGRVGQGQQWVPGHHPITAETVQKEQHGLKS